MPYVLIRNKEVIENKIIDLSRYLNLSNPSFNSFLEWILDLRKSLSIPHTLKELIDDDSIFKIMSVMALNDPSTGTNPIQLNESDFLQLYQNSFEGKL